MVSYELKPSDPITSDNYGGFIKAVKGCIFQASGQSCTMQHTEKPIINANTDWLTITSEVPDASKADVDSDYENLNSAGASAMKSQITLEFNRLDAFVKTNDGTQFAADVQNIHTDFTTASDLATSSNKAYANIQSLTASNYYVDEGPVTCSGLFWNGRSTNFSVTTKSGGSAVVADVTIWCNPPVFASSGFGADWIDNRTYQTVPANTAGLPTPAPHATARPGIIAQSNTGARYLLPTALLNWTPWPLDYEGNAIGLSTGVGTALNGGGGFKADVLLGLSFVWHHAVLITGGRAFGTSTVLAPGYKVGGPIIASTSPPVTTAATSGWFVGITYNFTSAKSNNSSDTNPKAGSGGSSGGGGTQP